MSPQSLLYTPVDLLQSAPHGGEQASSGEGRERRAALVVLGGLALVMVAVLAIALQGARKAPCAGATAHGATPPACSVRA